MKKLSLVLIAMVGLLGAACEEQPADVINPNDSDFGAYCRYQRDEIARRIDNYTSLFDSVDTADEAQAVIDAGDLIISAEFAMEEWCGVNVDVSDVEKKTELLREFDI